MVKGFVWEKVVERQGLLFSFLAFTKCQVLNLRVSKSWPVPVSGLLVILVHAVLVLLIILGHAMPVPIKVSCASVARCRSQCLYLRP